VKGIALTLGERTRESDRDIDKGVKGADIVYHCSDEETEEEWRRTDEECDHRATKRRKRMRGCINSKSLEIVLKIASLVL
jgi:hypothetical protein